MMEKSELRNLREILRDEMVQRDRIAAVLRDGPKTLPEIAAALGEPVYEVTLWVMGMRRYGRLHEVPKGREEDYYRYEMTEGAK
ncbi:MAG: MarR family transcriptional regulator [Thermoplasmata archaeon]